MADFRRKAPRKKLEGKAGCLYKGQLEITDTFQLGEGGALIATSGVLAAMDTDDMCVLTLFLPNIGGIVATAQCVYRSENDRLGLQFHNLDMIYKKKIREFVSRRKSIAEAA